ncbi:unnamed protein product [Trichobilharzia regenti]|nr:unnamed protein product [Trichobilharzia regenti]
MIGNVCPCRVYKYIGEFDINPSNIRRTASQQDKLYLYDMSSCSSKTERNTSCSKEFPIYPHTDICQHNNTTLLNYNHFNNLPTTHNYLQQQNTNELSLSEDENLVKLSAIKDNGINNEYISSNDDDERNDYLQKHSTVEEPVCTYSNEESKDTHFHTLPTLLSNSNLFLSKYEMGPVIGKGGFGYVRSGRRLKDGKPVSKRHSLHSPLK